METQSFYLGVIIIYGVLLTILFIVGLIRINKFLKKQTSLENEISNIKLQIESGDKKNRRILEELSKDITIVERTIMQRIDKEIDQTNRHIEEEVLIIHQHEDELHKEIEEIKSYADSKINRIVMKGTFPTSKPKSKKYFNQDPL